MNDSPGTGGTPPAPETGAQGDRTPIVPAGDDRTESTPPGQATPSAPDHAWLTSAPTSARNAPARAADSRLEIIAHRGANHDAPENTLAAFHAASAQGADRIETDIRRTRDGVLVLHHDPVFSDNGPAIADVSWQEALGLARERGFELCRLGDALADLGPDMRWDLELKEGGYEEQVIEEALAVAHPGALFFSSFDDDIVRRIKLLRPTLQTGLLLGTDHPRLGWFTRVGELFPLHRAYRCGVDVLIPHRLFLPFGFLRINRRFRGRVWVWGVSEGKHLRRWIDTPGIHGLITDMPDQAHALR